MVEKHQDAPSYTLQCLSDRTFSSPLRRTPASEPKRWMLMKTDRPRRESSIENGDMPLMRNMFFLHHIASIEYRILNIWGYILYGNMNIWQYSIMGIYPIYLMNIEYHHCFAGKQSQKIKKHVFFSSGTNINIPFYPTRTPIPSYPIRSP